jgi:hypothetical protein
MKGNWGVNGTVGDGWDMEMDEVLSQEEHTHISGYTGYLRVGLKYPFRPESTLNNTVVHPRTCDFRYGPQ